MKFKSIFFFSFMMSFLFMMPSCLNSIEREAVIGKWRGIEIREGDEIGKRRPSDIYMEFRKDLTFTYKIGNEHESNGKWYIERTRLYAQGDDMEKIVVNIEHVTPDTLVLLQNRSGRYETWTLLRQE